MSEDQANSPSTSGTTKRARKNPRKKTARSAPKDAAAEADTAHSEPVASREKPEAVAAGDAVAESPKRGKRRRRKGKGEGAGGSAQAEGTAEATTLPDAAFKPARPKNDPELLAKFAWKIYLAEVSEEGVALIGDNDARELSRRCFRLAEIFIEEQTRRR